MSIAGNLIPFATALLQLRLDGKLQDPKQVLQLSYTHQPVEGFSNDEWNMICDFIEKLKPADNIPAAKKLAEEYGLEIKV